MFCLDAKSTVFEMGGPYLKEGRAALCPAGFLLNSGISAALTIPRKIDKLKDSSCGSGGMADALVLGTSSERVRVRPLLPHSKCTVRTLGSNVTIQMVGSVFVLFCEIPNVTLT